MKNVLVKFRLKITYTTRLARLVLHMDRFYSIRYKGLYNTHTKQSRKHVNRDSPAGPMIKLKVSISSHNMYLQLY